MPSMPFIAGARGDRAESERAARGASPRLAHALAAGLATLLVAASAVSAPDDDWDTWQRAVLIDDLDQVKRMVAAGHDVDDPARNGKTALMSAVKVGDRPFIEALLAGGADPNATNHKGGTVLMYAVLSGRTDIIERVLASGAALNDSTTTGWTALMIASAKDYAPLAQTLLRHGADANLQDIYGWTPLIRAAHEGHEQTLRVLLATPKLQLSTRDESGKTALHHAAAQGYGIIVRLLLDAGADPSATDAQGHSPAQLARLAGRAAVLPLFDRPGS